MRSANRDQKVDLGAVSRLWLPLDESKPLLAYTGERLGTQFTSDASFQFTLDSLGQPLNKDGILNLSFLRLVGASEDAGVGFLIKGVYSIDLLRETKERISAAARKFYIDFLRPVDLSITVSAMELRL